MSVAARISRIEAEIAQLVQQQARGSAYEQPSLTDFVRRAWTIVEPGTIYLHNWHLDCIAEYLEAVFEGQITRLLINVPPRSGKTDWASIFWPCWLWTRRPELRVMATSYSADLAIEHSIKRRLVLESPWYRDRWGGLVELSDDQNEKAQFTNTAQGAMIATSMTGTATGRGADILLVDDPHSAKRAESDVERATTVRDFRLVFSTRLNDKKKGAIVIIGQRLHVADLAGYAIEWGYEHLFLPAEATKRTVLVLPSGKTAERDNIVRLPSGRDIERQEGSLLWPEREGPTEIATAKRELGTTGYSGQYQQNPTPAGGTKFNRAWFRYFDDIGVCYVLHKPSGDERVYKHDCWIFQTCDLAMGVKASNDWTCIATWALTSGYDLLLLHINRFKKEAPDVTRELENSLAMRRPQFQGIERAHYGIAVCQEWLRRGFPLRELIADKDKVTRSGTAALYLENGKVYLLADANWLTDYESELLLFPNGVHDDQVDVTSYAGLILAENAVSGAYAKEVEPIDLGPENKRVF